MTSAVSVQLDSNDLGEQLTKLFPKCRPRDLNLNHLQRHDNTSFQTLDNNTYVMELTKQISRFGENVEDGGAEDEENGENGSGESACSSSDDQGNNDDDNGMDQSCSSDGQVIVLHSNKGATYKLRDSRIIEIAGGREVFSASRSKSVRKTSKANPDGVVSERKLTSRVPVTGPALASRELTETVFSTEVHSVKLQRDITGAVVFDDIEEGNSRPWKHERRHDRASAGSSPSPPSYHQTPSDFFKQVTSSLNDADNKLSQVDGKGIKMIGGLTITEYEGSPRRYGPTRPRGGDCSGSGGSSRPLPSAQSLLASPSIGPVRTASAQRSSPSPEANSPTSKAVDPSTCSTFDYLYEFSETRKVLEEFFKQSSSESTKHEFHDFDELGYELRRQAGTGSAYVGLRLAKVVTQEDGNAHHKTDSTGSRLENDGADVSLDSVSTEELGDTEVGLQVGLSRNFTLSPETTDCESNCGELDSEASLLLLENDGQHTIERSDGAAGAAVVQQDSLRIYSAMPVLEDGLSSGHASDTDNNNSSLVVIKRQGNDGPHLSDHPAISMNGVPRIKESRALTSDIVLIDPLSAGESTPPPPAPAPHRPVPSPHEAQSPESVEATLKDICQTLQRTKTLPVKAGANLPSSPVWVPRRHSNNNDSESKRSRSGDDALEEEEADTDLETDRLLGQQRTGSGSGEHGFYEDKPGWKKLKSRSVEATGPHALSTPPHEAPETTSPSPLKDPPLTTKPKKEREGGKKKGRNKEVVIHDPSVLIEGVLFRARYLGSTQLVCEGQPTKSTRMMQAEEAVSRIKAEVTNPLVSEGCVPCVRVPSPGIPLAVTVFRIQFLGFVEIDEEYGRKRRKRAKKAMVEEAVTKIKAPEGETQPSTEVDLFISTEKIMVLNTDLKEIMMDHALRTISYIADIGELVVLMARRRYVPHDLDESGKFGPTPKMICHVFESEEAQFIAQSIGQAFQVAYMEFLKANGIEDHSFVKEMDYQEVLNSQEIFGDELQMFAKKEMQKEVVVPKAKGEMLGVVIVESGWGSMLPTVVIANLAPAGAAARCGHLNIGDQIIAINGVSLVGLPLSTCQTYIKNGKNQTVVKLTVVPCAPVVEVKIKRPDTKYQLGFSVQNGVICSLLRGGIAERGGVRVGHRIIEINNQSVVAVPHEKIVNLLATSVGEILMKTMPTSMFRLLTGQETPLYI